MAPRRPQSEEMLSLLERHKIQVLLDAEFSAADVAKRTGVSLDTVRRVERESGGRSSQYYFRTTAEFEAPVGSKYAWLNNSVFVGVAERPANAAIIRFFEVK